MCTMGYVEHRLASLPNGYSMKRDRIEHRLSTIEILVTGSSHSFYAIKPGQLNKNAFSLAYISQDLFYDTRLLLKYAPEMPKLKLVIMTFSYFSLENDLQNTIESWRGSFYHQFYGLPPLNRLDISNYSLIALYGPSESRALFFNGFRSDSSESMEADGGAPDVAHESKNPDLSSEAALARHNSSMAPARIPKNIGYLEEALRMLQSRNVAVIFVTTPVYKSYYSHMDPNAYFRMQGAIRSLSEQNKIPYYNYINDLRFFDSDFFDCDHLSARGAAKFTEILRADVLGRYDFTVTESRDGRGARMQ
jgi:hypothetical protein